MQSQLSLLIPVYRQTIVHQVARYAELCRRSEDYIEWEIVVADDGSGDESVAANRAIGTWPRCRFIEQPENAGRAATRNLLAREARYPTLLFIDADMLPRDDNFIVRYASCSTGGNVVIGGIAMCPKQKVPKGNLRYRYEVAAAPQHTPQERAKRPYHCISVANMLAPRSAMLRCPFDERFRSYGYEDVLFGRALCEARIPICHIDNPVVWQDYGTNEANLAKIEQSLRTLHDFRDDLTGYSAILALAYKLEAWHIAPLVRWWHRRYGDKERRHLLGGNPKVATLKRYKIGYYLTLE